MHTAIVSNEKVNVSLPLLATGFQRGDGPLVSILIPICDVSEVVGVINSIYKLAYDVSRIECVFITSSQLVIDFLNGLDTNISFSIYPKYDITKIKGDWVLPFNTHARIITPSWDVYLDKTYIISTTGHMVSDICLLATRFFDFLFIRRQVLEVLQTLSLNPNNNNWICDVLYGVDSVFPSVIEIESDNEITYELENGSKKLDSIKLLHYISSKCKDVVHPNRVKLWKEYDSGV